MEEMQRSWTEPLDVQLHAMYLAEGPFMRSLPDTSLEWIGKYEFFPPPSSWEGYVGNVLLHMPAQTKKALLGSYDGDFKTSEQIELAVRLHLQHAVGNHLLFSVPLPWETLQQLSELAGYGKLPTLPKIKRVGAQHTMDGF